MKGPDFPTGAYIYGREGIKEAYETGRGRVVMRARAQIEEKESSGRAQIVITEIPYQVNKENLVKAIAELAADKKIDGISGVNDESDKDGMRMVVDLKRDAIPNVVLNQLYKHTAMQSTFGVIMLALDKGVPKVMNLKELLERYIEHRHDIIVRRTQFELAAAEAREHILEGLKIAVDNIDEVIKIIRGSEDTAEADARLRKRFGLSEKQSDAILNMRLAQLTGLEIEKLEAELKEVRGVIKDLEEHPGQQGEADGDPQERDGRGRRAVRRRPSHRDPERPGRVHDRGPDRRGGHGHHHLPLGLHQADPDLHLPAAAPRRARAQRGRPKDDDWVEHLFIASTHDYLLFFTNQGQLYWLKVHEIPQAGARGPGQAGRQLHRHQAGRADRRAGAGAGVHRRPLSHVRHPPGHGEEDRALGLRQPAHATGSAPSTSRTGDELIDVQVCDAQQRHRARHPRRHEHPLPRGRRARDGPRDHRREGHRAGEERRR